MEQLHQYSKIGVRQCGQLLIELLIALAVSSILIPAITTGFVASRQGVSQERQRLEATALAREMDDAVRVVRDAGWINVATDGTYHLVISGTTWALAEGSEILNGYTKSVVIADVSRDIFGKIVLSGGLVDQSTKKVTVTVSWGTPIVSSVSNSFYITRLTNQSWVQTTQADFDAGTKNGVITTNTNGGEVTLGFGGKADWCEPNLSITALDLPKSGVANAITAIEGRVFAGTGNNASGVSFANVSLSDTDPPTAIVSGTFDGFKTNGIFGEANYAYLATDNNAKEIEIINLTTNPYSEAGYFNAPGNGNGNSIFVAGTVGYMTSGNKFYTFDLASKSGSRSQLGTVTLAATGSKIFVVGNYAYVAIAGASTEMQIINVTNPSNLSVVGQADVNGQAAIDVFVNSNGTRSYLATGTDASKPEFFIIDTSIKTGNRPTLGTFDTAGMNPKGVTVVPGNKAILVGTGGSQQYQIIDITDETHPTHCTSGGRSGGLAVATGVNGVASVLEADGDAYSYIITGDVAAELKIIEGGPGGKYAVSGTFESSILDATSSSAFNRFIANSLLPDNTTVEYQVSGADAASGSCAGAAFTYIGPDGTGATKFATSSAIPFSNGPGYKTPARCFRYKTFLSTKDQSSAPVFTDMTLNFSP
jgi:type II secretory pathway pseudopilin PulG